MPSLFILIKVQQSLTGNCRKKRSKVILSLLLIQIQEA